MVESEKDGGAIILRRGLLLVFLLGSVGLGAELLLLGHFEEWRQLVPLVLLGCGLVLSAARLILRGAFLLRLFRLTMLAFVAAGLLGCWFHLNANMEFELELYPTLAGLELLSGALGRSPAGAGARSPSPVGPGRVAVYIPAPGPEPEAHEGELD